MRSITCLSNKLSATGQLIRNRFVCYEKEMLNAEKATVHESFSLRFQLNYKVWTCDNLFFLSFSPIIFFEISRESSHWVFPAFSVFKIFTELSSCSNFQSFQNSSKKPNVITRRGLCTISVKLPQLSKLFLSLHRYFHMILRTFFLLTLHVTQSTNYSRF